MVFCLCILNANITSRNITSLLLHKAILWVLVLWCVEYCHLAVGSGHCLTHTDSCRKAYTMTIWSDAAVLDSSDVMSWSTEVLWTALDTNSKCSFFCKVTAPSRSLPAQHSLVFSTSVQASTDIIPRLSAPPIFLPACSPQPEHDTITYSLIMHALKKSEWWTSRKVCKRKDNVAKEPCCFPPRIPFFLQVVSDKHAFQSRVIGVSLIQAFLASCGTFFHYCTTSIERRTHPFHLTNPLWRSCTSFTIPTHPHCCLILHEWRWPHLHQTVLLTLHSANLSDSREYASFFLFFF